jgi:hypothetical protein
MSSSSDDDEIGYGKPPKANRFKKGQSGNPKGRPTGAKGVKASLKRELNSKITIREGNREIKVSKFEALAKRLMANALKGDIKSLLELLKLDDELFGANDATLESGDAITSPTETDLAILRDFFAPEPTYGEEDDDDSA